MTSAKAKELKCTYLKPGDILIARMPDPLGRACFFPGDSKPCVTVVDICIVRVNPSIVHSQWLVHFINSSNFQRQITNSITGTTRQRISRGNLAKVEIPLPSLEEQKRIAAILDKADAIRRKRQQAIDLTDQLLRSVFLDMFGDPVTNPKGWEKVKLDELCDICRGGSPRPIQDYLGGNIPWIKIGDATKDNDIYIESTKEKIYESGLSKTRLLKPGALIFANCGVSLGFARILKIAGCIHDGWLSIEIMDKRLNQIFLLKAINQITKHFQIIAPDGTQPNLNTSIMKDFELILPPNELQEKFEKIVQNVNSMRKNFVEASDIADRAVSSITQRAFSGELSQVA